MKNLSVRQLKALIKWCKDQRIQEIQLGDVRVVFALEPIAVELSSLISKPEETDDNDTKFWSS